MASSNGRNGTCKRCAAWQAVKPRPTLPRTHAGALQDLKDPKASPGRASCIIPKEVPWVRGDDELIGASLECRQSRGKGEGRDFSLTPASKEPLLAQAPDGRRFSPRPPADDRYTKQAPFGYTPHPDFCLLRARSLTMRLQEPFLPPSRDTETQRPPCGGLCVSHPEPAHIAPWRQGCPQQALIALHYF